jgi:Ni/Fe-hydrogenase subunit HybB-like protein
VLDVDKHDRERLIDPLFHAGRRYWFWLLVLGALVGVGVVAYLRQLVVGLAVTGLHRPAYWGIYMVNFIFLIGVSMAGTLVSASLYLLNVEWRRPITRIAETVTVCGLSIAALQIVFDMGRPDRTLLLFRYGRLQSPLLWDMLSLSTYLLTSIFALYITLLPDLAVVRDNYPAGAPAWRRQIYAWLALGWRGNRTQWLRLEKAIKVVSILIIPIGVSLHTVTAWILATTVQPGWHSTIMGPYFVVGAIFSGVALLLVLLVVFRQAYGLQRYIGHAQFQNLSMFLIVMSIVWFYFTYTEHMVQIAGQLKDEFPVLASKLWGPDAPAFWGMVILMIVAAGLLIVPRLIPASWATRPLFQPRFAAVSATAAAGVLALLLLDEFRPTLIAADLDFDVGGLDMEQVLRVTFWLLVAATAISVLPWFKRHAVTASVVASVCIVLGMWFERWIIIVPTLAYPLLIPWARYVPTPTEWVLMIASFALLGFMFMVIFKLVPPVSIWEVAEGRVVDEAESVVEYPMPAPTPTARERRRASRSRRFSWER